MRSVLLSMLHTLKLLINAYTIKIREWPSPGCTVNIWYIVAVGQNLV